jgi:hypothetical protein
MQDLGKIMIYIIAFCTQKDYKMHWNNASLLSREVCPILLNSFFLFTSLLKLPSALYKFRDFLCVFTLFCTHEL